MGVTLAPVGSDHATEVSLVLENLVRTLVGDPEGVRVTAFTSMDKTVLRLHVSRQDVGKVVGKDGRTARALRTILAAAGQAHGQKFSLDIEEPSGD